MQRDAVLQLSPDALFRELDRESVVLDLSSGRYFGLNAVGTRVWQLIQQGEPVEGVIRRVSAEYDAGADVIERDVLALLGELKARGLVLEPPGTGT